MKGFIAAVLIMASLGVFVTVTIISVRFDQECTGFLKRAGDANNVEGAKKELDRAIAYLEAHNLTSGYTSVLYQTPDEDIAFWYNNLKAAQNELYLAKNSSQMEKSNVLIKLRETLMDHGNGGDVLTYPEGISRYPSNGIWCVFMWVAAIVFVGTLIGIAIVITD